MTSLAHALDIADSARADSVAALRDLVRIRSLTGEEGDGARHVAARLRDMGAEVTLVEPDLDLMFELFPDIAQYPTHWQHDLILPYERLPTLQSLRDSGLDAVLNYRGRPNVVGRLPGSGGGRSLVINTHVDTVTVEPADRWTHDPFGGEIEAGLMYGRGTSDMKGGIAAALAALGCIREAGLRLRGDVIFQCVVNEEHAGNGTLDLVCRGISGDAAIVLEPTGNTIVVSHPGGLYWQVTIPGVPRSPGARWRGGEQDGISAIEKVPAIVGALLAMERRYNEAGDADARPFSLVMGRISGGHYETVTAGEVVIKGGAYFAPEIGSVGDVMARFRDAIRSANEADPLLRAGPARLEFLHHDDSTDQAGDIEVARVMGTVLAARSGDAVPYRGAFCCDMRHLVNQGRMPAIIFGPGSIAQAHKPDEHIALDDYHAAIGHLIQFIWTWCNGEPAEIQSQAPTGPGGDAP